MGSIGFPELDQLAGKIESLRKEYDLYFSRNRKTEPTSLRSEVAQKIILLTRGGSASTVWRFRLQNLAHRFRVLEQQIRSRLGARERRSRAGRAAAPLDQVSVLVDRAALAHPGVVEGHLRGLHRTVRTHGMPVPDLESFKDRLLREAADLLEQSDAEGVRFRLRTDVARGARVGVELVKRRAAG